MRKRKPRIFIASSMESLPIADAINVNLDITAETIVWPRSTPSSNFIDVLLEHAHSVDFAAFICSPDDFAVMRGEEKQVIRDNVLFELGLFMGSLGKNRCFVVIPRGEDVHTPSDLLGFTAIHFDGNRSDGDLISATRAAGTLMSEVMNRMEPVEKTSLQKEPEKIEFELLDSFPTAKQIISRDKINQIFLKFNKPVDRDSTVHIGNLYVQRNSFAQWNIAGWIEFAEGDTKLIWHVKKDWLDQDDLHISEVPDYPLFEIHIGREPEDWRLKDVDGNMLPRTIIPVIVNG